MKRNLFLDAMELASKEYIEVFTIKADERGFLGPNNSSVSFPIEFSAPVAGTFHEEYTLVFDQNHPEVYQLKQQSRNLLIIF